jgi:hypothetical protein
MKRGQSAGGVSVTLGYHQIRYNKVLYYSHRLAVLAMTGVEAESHVDHINSDKSDNRWSNLRVASHQQNLSYRPKPKNNTSGQKGVYWASRDKVWIARFSNYKIGHSKDFDEACRMYKEYTQELLGEFYYDKEDD